MFIGWNSVTISISVHIVLSFYVIKSTRYNHVSVTVFFTEERPINPMTKRSVESSQSQGDTFLPVVWQAKSQDAVQCCDCSECHSKDGLPVSMIPSVLAGLYEVLGTTGNIMHQHVPCRKVQSR